MKNQCICSDFHQALFKIMLINFFLSYIYIAGVSYNIATYIYIYILNYKSHKRDFIKTSTVCFTFMAHQEVILIQIEFLILFE